MGFVIIAGLYVIGCALIGAVFWEMRAEGDDEKRLWLIGTFLWPLVVAAMIVGDP